MDDRNRRSWRVASDKLGPGTAIRPRLSRRGIGGFLMVRGNPVSFTVDPIIGCVPFLSLNGGRDAQSQATRNALDAQPGESTSSFLAGLLPGLAPADPTTPSTATPPATNGNTGSTQGTPSTVPTGPVGGPFWYVSQSKTGHY
jgi:hypothetical protein